MKTEICLALTLMMLALPARAQDDPLNDAIHLALPDGGICATAGYLDRVTMNIIVDCPSHATIWYFECGLVIDNQTNTLLMPHYTNPCLSCDHPAPVPGFLTLYNLMTPPLPSSPHTLLARVDIYYLDVEPLYFHLVGARPSSTGEDLPAYLADDWGGPLVSLTPLPTGLPYDFAINAPDCSNPAPAPIICGPVPDEAMSWGAVKSLYR